MRRPRSNQKKLVKEIGTYFFTLSLFIKGTIAFRMKDIDNTLGTHRNETTEIHAKSVFTDLMNRGRLMYPTQKLLDQVKIMYAIFCVYNPNYTLRDDPNCIAHLRKLLELKMQDHNLHPKILDFVSHLLIYVRLGYINKQVKIQKDEKSRYAQSLRGCKKTATLARS